MIEPVMYFGIGFLVAALLGLLFVPLVHNRAVRLTMRRLEAATPLSIAEIRADKDQLRAEFAMSTRRLEMSVEQMKTKTTSQLAELGKKTDAINQLKKELGEKTATIFALEARDKTLREQLRATEEEFELKTSSLREAERTLADKEAELVKLVAELGEHSIIADSQRVELAALRTQVEAMKVSVADYERTVKDTEQRLERERSDAEATASGIDRGARQTRRPRRAHHRSRAAAFAADHRSRGSAQARPGARSRNSATRAACWPSAITRSNGCATSRSRAPDRNRSAQRVGIGRRPQLPAPRTSSVPTSSSSKRSSRSPSRSAPSCSASLSIMKRDAELTWASERVENALLRERINDVAAEVARLTAALEGPGSTDRVDARRRSADFGPRQRSSRRTCRGHQR